MINSNKYLPLLLSLLGFTASNCVDPFEAATEDFESALVIEAVISNEEKFQEIILSRAYRLESNAPLAESNATVMIVENGQTEYSFQEGIPGIYHSTGMFSAQPGSEYQLFITTSDGRAYSSRPGKLSRNTPMEDLYAAAEINDLGIEGVSIFVDTFDPEGRSRYYRYDYEETYKIIAPRWAPQDLVIVRENPPFLRLEPKAQEERVCFNTANSLRLIVGNTLGFQEDRLTRFPIRFLPRDDYIISHRYSILVRQYIISREAHAYYETLSEFSGSESIFSENQPGFLSGNIVSESNPEEKVVGFLMCHLYHLKGYFLIMRISSRKIWSQPFQTPARSLRLKQWNC